MSREVTTYRLTSTVVVYRPLNVGWVLYERTSKFSL